MEFGLEMHIIPKGQTKLTMHEINKLNFLNNRKLFIKQTNNFKFYHFYLYKKPKFHSSRINHMIKYRWQSCRRTTRCQF